MHDLQRYKLTFPSDISSDFRNDNIGKHALIFGSAPSSLSLADADLSGLQAIAINNAWQIRPDIKYAIYATDFPEAKRPPRSWFATQVTGDTYGTAMATAGGELLCGATMAFVAGYWACENLSTAVIGYYGCDMIYNGAGQTHFYGTGRPDPLRDHLSLRSLEAKALRLFCWGLKRGIVIVNCSPNAATRLVFPRVPLNGLANFAPSLKRWSGLLARAEELFEMERHPPYREFRRDTLDRPETQACRDIIDTLDRHWLDLIPLLGETDGAMPKHDPLQAHASEDLGDRTLEGPALQLD